MTLQAAVTKKKSPKAEYGDSSPWLTIVGIGEDGWEGLSNDARQAVSECDRLYGGARHLALIPEDLKPANATAWPSPLKPFLGELLEKYRGMEKQPSVCLLASGDPLLHGIGGLLVRKGVTNEEMRIIPQLSCFALICARLCWSQVDTHLVNCCGQPVETLNRVLFDNARIVLLTAGPQTAYSAAVILKERGFDNSSMSVFENVGGPSEKRTDFTAANLTKEHGFSALNAVAIDCRANSDAHVRSPLAGLPDNAFIHDGQITKREIRAATLARLSPRPGELLWDIGAGAGSVAIEWLRASLEMRAMAIEARSKHIENIRKNAFSLGVPHLQIIEGLAPDILADLPAPDAIFIGGGLTSSDMIDTAWRALKPGGRLVANAVTIESERLLLDVYGELGGELTRYSISHPGRIGRFTSWRPALPVVQWAIAKPFKGMMA